MRLFRLQLYLYLRLRSRQTLRVMSGVGIARCVVIVVLAMALLVVVAKADRPWVAPVVSAVWLLFYNNERRDRRFLAVNFKYAKALMACEYVLACLPFIVAEVLADRGFGACAIVLVSAVVPFFRVVKIGACVIPLPFFYKGGVEYFRLFRRYGFLYLLMLSAAVMGAVYGNWRVAAVSLMAWSIVQFAAVASAPPLCYLVHYQDFASYHRHLACQAFSNVGLVSAPLLAIAIMAGAPLGGIAFSLSAAVGGMLCFYNVGMVRLLLPNGFALAVYVFLVLVPLLACACLFQVLLCVFVVMDLGMALSAKSKFKRIWN